MSLKTDQKLPIPKPRWLKRRIPSGGIYQQTHKIIRKNNIHTVCQEANCPNMGECFSKSTATFLILGDRCTRDCHFCAVAKGPTGSPDPEEPRRVASAARKMKLDYVVITSVTRDDLPDGGAQMFRETIKEVRENLPDALVEVLIPDFQGNGDALETVLNAKPDVLNHNLETVSRLYPKVRPQAIYERSLELLKRVASYKNTIPVKSGIMIGLGETSDEVRKTLEDLLFSGCEILTLGQYLQPSKAQLPVDRFIHPEEFLSWRREALEMGFSEVASGPFVRSSYNAREIYQGKQSDQRESG